MLYQNSLDWSKLKAFADNKENIAQMETFGGIQKIVEKRESACYLHLFLFPKCFPKAFSSGKWPLFGMELN